MPPLKEHEKFGIADLLINEEQNIPILLQVAKSVTKNVCDIESAQEAIEYIYTHIDDVFSLLNKRHITKEILFKYLHQKKIAVQTGFTKTTLITKVIEYWSTNSHQCQPIADNSLSSVPEYAEQITQQPYDAITFNNGSFHQQELQQWQYNTFTPITSISDGTESQYPIHLLARKFSEWFFDNYNQSELKDADFWSDASLQLQIIANDRVDTHKCISSDEVITSLLRAKLQFGFYFNPNITHAGVQGRMDPHGLVLVLACGTLHTKDNCVGIFECTFGLLRDPFAENNWKVKTIQCTLRSQGMPHTPSIYESETLKDALKLPVPPGELS